MLQSYKSEASTCLKLGSSHETFLHNLTEAEVLGRETRQIETRIKQAGFPHIKTLETFDFASLPHLDKKRVMDLTNGDYLSKAENILALGSSGTGKTHLAIALGLAACQKGHSVLFKTAASLVHELIEAHNERQLLSMQKKLKNQKLLIIDELGYVPFSKTGAELLFEVFSQRYEKTSMIVTSNLPFEEWPQVFGCTRLTGALLDRLTHHVHILEMNGESYRLKNRDKDKDKVSAKSSAESVELQQQIEITDRKNKKNRKIHKSKS